MLYEKKRKTSEMRIKRMVKTTKKKLARHGNRIKEKPQRPDQDPPPKLVPVIN